MLQQRALIFIESNTTGTGHIFVQVARDEGLVPLLLTENASRYPRLIEDGVQVCQVDTGDEDAIFRSCEQLSKCFAIAGVISTSDYFIVKASSVAKKLGLPGSPSAKIAAARQKDVQYERLRTAGVRVPRTVLVLTRNQAVSAAKMVGVPVVLKPVAGSGSVGVKLCSSLAEVDTHSGSLLRDRVNERGIPVRRECLVQELVDGPEFSVEVISGQVFGITRKYLSEAPFFVEVGHDFPAQLSLDIRSELERTAIHAVQALGLCWGPVHVELRLSSNGPTIIEVNPRLAGGMIPHLMKLATGIDPIAAVVRLATGQHRAHTPALGSHASIRFILPLRSGLLSGYTGLSVARNVPHVVDVSTYRQLGEPILIRGDFRDRVGHIIVSAADARDAHVAAAESMRHVKVQLVDVADHVS